MPLRVFLLFILTGFSFLSWYSSKKTVGFFCLKQKSPHLIGNNFPVAWKVKVSLQITVGELTSICQQEMATDVVFYWHFHLLVWFLGPSSGVSVMGTGDSMAPQRRNSWTSWIHALLLLSLSNFLWMQEHVPVKFSPRTKVIFPSLRNFRILRGYRCWLKQHIFFRS